MVFFARYQTTPSPYHLHMHHHGRHTYLHRRLRLIPAHIRKSFIGSPNPRTQAGSPALLLFFLVLLSVTETQLSVAGQTPRAAAVGNNQRGACTRERGRRRARDTHLSWQSSRGSRPAANQRATLTPLCSRR